MDVEAILKQIRERVVSEQSGVSDTRLSAERSSTNGSASTTNHDDALRRLGTHLVITGRTADRLPPVSSNRDGTSARLELWIKKKSKSLTRWFTWEQVNFNRTVNNALSDVVEILKAEAQESATHRAQITQDTNRQLSILRADLQALNSDQQLFRAENEARLNETVATLARIAETITEMAAEHSALVSGHATLATKHNGLTAEYAKLADEVIDLAARLREEDREIQLKQGEEINRRLAELAADLKAEQGVCFRQLSLETSELAVLEDRARRAVLARLEKLEEDLKGRKS